VHMKFGLWIIAVINTARDLGSVKTKCSQPDGSGKMYNLFSACSVHVVKLPTALYNGQYSWSKHAFAYYNILQLKYLCNIFCRPSKSGNVDMVCPLVE
jgi:hypothetical protein